MVPVSPAKPENIKHNIYVSVQKPNFAKSNLKQEKTDVVQGWIKDIVTFSSGSKVIKDKKDDRNKSEPEKPNVRPRGPGGK